MNFLLKNCINETLIELGLPELKVFSKVKTINDMMSLIIKGYQKETKIQSLYGGIRYPAAVLQNKIRHDLTNYDVVRDAITLKYRSNTDLVFALREELLKMAHELCGKIIDLLPNVRISEILITPLDLRRANDAYLNRELVFIKREQAILR